jgi:hypothetical protein
MIAIESNSKSNKLMTTLLLISLVSVVLMMPSLQIYVNAQPNATPSFKSMSNNTYSTLTLTPNQIAAGGPIPPNYTMALQEAKCAAALKNPPWFLTIMPTEHFDSGRTDLFACAQFPGSYTGPNNVYAYESSDVYKTPFNIATRGINEMYVYGGGNGDQKPPGLQTFVARVEPGSLKELWRTYLNNANITNDLHLSGSVDILADGSLGAAAEHSLYKINGTTGAVEAIVTLPTGSTPPGDAAFNGFSAWPDGNLVLKSFNRPVGCTLNGYAAAAFKCPGAPASGGPSVLSVVDPKNWKVLSWVQAKENSAGRISTTQYHGKDYAYFAGTSSLYRYVWDGKNITLDTSWGPVSYLKPGQTGAGAVVLAGDWVILSTNGIPTSKVPLSVVAVSQANANKIFRIDPIPLKPGENSNYYAHLAVDPPNNRIYTMDAGAHKAAGVNFNPKTGNMTVAWVEPQWSQNYITLLGPTDKRVFVNTNMSSRVTQNATKLDSGPVGANYVEQIQWRDANTGKLLAASDFFPPSNPAGNVPVGYGGLIYNMLNNGHILTLKVLPKTNMTSLSTAGTTNTTKTTTGENLTPGGTSK